MSTARNRPSVGAASQAKPILEPDAGGAGGTDWFGSVAFVPLGYLIAAPIAALLGTSVTLFFAATWAAGSCSIVLTIPSIRNLRRTGACSPAAT